MRADAPKFEWIILDGDLVDNAISIIASEQISEDHCFDRTGRNRPPWLMLGQRSECGIYDAMMAEVGKDEML